MVDPIAAIVVSLLVGWTAFHLLRSALHLSLDGVPEGLDTEAVERWLRTQPGVADVHDLHVWSLSTTKIALTAHLVVSEETPGHGSLNEIAEGLADVFGIGHSTIQIERSDDPACRLAPADIP